MGVNLAVSGADAVEDVTLESLARRVTQLEAVIGGAEEAPSSKDWRRAIGMFSGSSFMDEVDEYARRIREAERELAASGRPTGD